MAAAVRTPMPPWAGRRDVDQLLAVARPWRVPVSLLGWDHDVMRESDDADVGRAPICPYCGVTALPAETSNVIDSGFVCDNADCSAFGDAVES
jgi:hypothetical protein